MKKATTILNKEEVKISAIIPSAGQSSRYGKNKLLEKINGKEVISYSVEKISASEDIIEIILPTSEGLMPILAELFKDNPKIKIIKGGKTRQESVSNALNACSEPDFVLIHDAARPLVKPEKITECIENARIKGASILAVKAVDTIKTAGKDKKISKTLDRDELWMIQTPQVFKFDKILKAHKTFEGCDFSDDAGMLEKLGYDVFITEGDYSNIKITTPADIVIAQELLKSSSGPGGEL